MQFFNLHCSIYFILKKQWNELGGKCGTCGDPYDAPVRENEAGGIYATGAIGKRYKRGDIIKVGQDLKKIMKNSFFIFFFR